MSVSSAISSGDASTAEHAEHTQEQSPSLRRRLAAFTYEGVLLFGLVMVIGAIYSIGTNQRHGLHGRQGMMAAQFLGLAIYFLWFWVHGGQTLAMKTWHIKLVSATGGPISPKQALQRFLLSWLWFMPSWIGAWLAGWHQSKLLYGAMAVWVLFYAGMTRFLPHRQFLHDTLVHTRLVDIRPGQKA